MKYFTSKWWRSRNEKAQRAVSVRYTTYINSVRDRLPSQLLDLFDNYTLHDSRVVRIAVLPKKAEVRMSLRGFDRNLDNEVLYDLRFLGVERFDQGLPVAERAGRELGDLGYWEMELLESGVEIRMLFESGAEFLVECSEFEFNPSVRA